MESVTGLLDPTIGYLLIAALVYEKLGLCLLQTMWINLDLIWVSTLFLIAFQSVVISRHAFMARFERRRVLRRQS
jgi:hypothetical protein